MGALQREADRLAGEARTLLSDLRRLEIERDLQTERVRQAQAAVLDAAAALQQISDRLLTLEQQRVARLPNVEASLVHIYKRNRHGDARLVLGAQDLREFGRTVRLIGAMTKITEQRIAEHRRMLDSLREERAALDRTRRDLEANKEQARQAESAAARAITSRTALIARIDASRDLNAQLAGELQVARQQLQEQIAAIGAGRPAEPISIPLAPFKGALRWPVVGALAGRFGEASANVGGAPGSGIEISAPESTPVRAVHAGTVGYADAFTGFGTLVILDHGANHFSLYGFLGSTTISQGDAVEEGGELGRVGFSPAGLPVLYFEMRIDGRSVDPIQWLRTGKQIGN
jgi:septal ring factor EnvC (AmiA/AmiB activator)